MIHMYRYCIPVIMAHCGDPVPHTEPEPNQGNTTAVYQLTSRSGLKQNIPFFMGKRLTLEKWKCLMHATKSKW